MNGVALGFVKTHMAADDGLETAEFKKEYEERRRIPLGRPGSVADCVSTVMFLASDSCQWMTGETIHQDGGLHTTF